MATRLTVESSTATITIMPDWPINVTSTTGTGVVNVDLPANQAANRPIVIHVVLVPQGTSIAGLAPSLILSSWPAAMIDVPADGTVDTPLSISVVGVNPGTYTIVVIGEFPE